MKDPTEGTLTALDQAPLSLALGLTEGTVIALDPMGGTVAALDPIEGAVTTLDPMEGAVTVLDPTEGVSMLTAPDPTEGMPRLTAPPMLTALDPADGMVFLTAPDLRHLTPTECMAFSPDPTAGPVEAGRLPVPGSEDDLNQCPNYLLGAVNWGWVTVTAATRRSQISDTQIPTSRTTPKGTSLRPTTSRSPPNWSDRSRLLNRSPLLNGSRLSMILSNRSRNQNCPPAHLNLASDNVLAPVGPMAKPEKDEGCLSLSGLGSAQDCHLNLCSMASYCVLAPTGPLVKDESCPSLSGLGSAQDWHLNLCPMAPYYVLALAGPLVKDESCPSLSALGSAEAYHLNLCPLASYYVPGSSDPLAKNESCPSLLTPRSAEEDRLNPLATLGNATTAPAPTDSVSLTTPSSAAYPSCLLRSSTTYPMGSNASVQLSHPRLH